MGEEERVRETDRGRGLNGRAERGREKGDREKNLEEVLNMIRSAIILS